MSKKYLRELFNQKQTRCRSCERCIVNGVSDGGVRSVKVKALFHPRPWMSQAQCSHRLNNNKWERFTLQFANIAEEMQELERVRERLEEERLNARRARKNVLRLFRRLKAQTTRIEEQLRDHSERVSDDVNVVVQDQPFTDLTTPQ